MSVRAIVESVKHTRDLPEEYRFGTQRSLIVERDEEVELSRAIMDRISQLAGREMSVDEVYPFRSIASTDAVDSYFTRMTAKTLRNYANDAKTGSVPFMNSHRTGNRFGLELPIGRLFDGKVTSMDKVDLPFGEQTRGATQGVITSQYLLRDVTLSNVANNDLIRAIESGVIFDNSIGFDANAFICSICQNDFYAINEDHTAYLCTHWPGEMYDGQMCVLDVTDGRLVELSAVYSGATPGAVVLRAQDCLERGIIQKGDVAVLEDRYHTRIRDLSVFTRAELPTPSAERTDPPADPTPPAQTDEERNEQLRVLEEAISTACATAVAADRAAIAALPQTEVQKFADIGKRHMDKLRADCIAEGIRAHGNAFNVETYRGIIGNLDEDQIREMTASFSRTKAGVFQPGRQTERVDPNGDGLVPAPVEELPIPNRHRVPGNYVA